MPCHPKVDIQWFWSIPWNIPRLVPAKRLRHHWRAQVPNPALRWADWSLPQRHPWHWDMVGVAHGISRALPGPSLHFNPPSSFHQIQTTLEQPQSPTFSPGFLEHPQGSRMTWMTFKKLQSILYNSFYSYCSLNLWILPEIAIIEEILRPKSRCWVEEMSPLSLTFLQISCPSLLQLVPDLSLAAITNIQEWLLSWWSEPYLKTQPWPHCLAKSSLAIVQVTGPENIMNNWRDVSLCIFKFANVAAFRKHLWAFQCLKNNMAWRQHIEYSQR